MDMSKTEMDVSIPSLAPLAGGGILIASFTKEREQSSDSTR